MNALGFGRLREDRLGQFVPPGAKHRPGRLVGSRAEMLAAGGEHASDLDILRTLTRQLRTKAWDALRGPEPGMAATAAEPLIIDLDATLVIWHSDKESVAGTYKAGNGFAPFVAIVDYGAGNGSREILAAVLRPGNGGANSAEDHIRVFHTAAAQLPESFLNEAGASWKFLWQLHSLGVQFSTSYTLPVGKAHLIYWITDKQYWRGARTGLNP